MAQTCPDCSDLNQKCDTCIFVAKIDQIIESLQIMGQNKPQNLLYGLRAEMEAENPIADSYQGEETIKQLGKLAKDYSQLELETQRAVRKIRSYGENCKEAAEDFLVDGNLKELSEELVNNEESKTSLRDATNNYNQIK